MPPLHPRLLERLARVRLVALDIDGVLTDGRVVMSPQGEVQSYCVQDGLGIKLLQREGLEIAWISGRGGDAARLRAEELGVRELHLRSGPKDVALAAVQARLSIRVDETLSMGDDLPDLAMARASALFVSVPNGRAEVRARAHFVTRSPGGAGAVRELAEHLLRSRGRWQAVLDAHGG